VNDLANRIAKFLVEQSGPRIPWVLAERLLEPIDDVVRACGALVDQGRAERVCVDGARCWAFRARGVLPTAGMTARALCAAAEATSAGSEATADRTHRRNLKPKNWDPVLQPLLRQHGPQTFSGLADLAGCSINAVTRWVRGRDGYALLRDLSRPSHPWVVRLVDQVVPAAPDRTAALVAALRAQGPLFQHEVCAVLGIKITTLRSLLPDLGSMGSPVLLTAIHNQRIYHLGDQDPNDRVARKERDRRAAFLESRKAAARTCRVCGCTEADIRPCAQRTGWPCHWVAADLCSACERDPAACQYPEVRALFDLIVPAGPWGVGFDLIKRRCHATLGAELVSAALASAGFAYESIDRHGITFIRQRLPLATTTPSPAAQPGD
jgi:hypothetical protein